MTVLTIIQSIATILLLIAATICIIIETRREDMNNPEASGYKAKGIPRFYCPHCKQFRKRHQIHIENCWEIYQQTCKYCGKEVADTQPYFKEFIDNCLSREVEEKKVNKQKKKLFENSKDRFDPEYYFSTFTTTKDEED